MRSSLTASQWDHGAEESADGPTDPLEEAFTGVHDAISVTAGSDEMVGPSETSSSSPAYEGDTSPHRQHGARVD